MGAVAQYLLYRIREALEYMMGAWSLTKIPKLPVPTQERWRYNFTAIVRTASGMFPNRMNTAC